MLAIFVYYTYSRTQLYFTQQYSTYTTTCFGPICWPFLCITHTVEHNCISPSRTVRIQLRVSALYVGHFCALHIQSNTTIFHPAIQYVYNYMFRSYMLAIFVYYTYSRTQLYFTQQYSTYRTTCFGTICGPSSGCDLNYRTAIQDVWGVLLGYWGLGEGNEISLFQ